MTETNQPQQPAQASQPGQVSQADDPAAPDSAELAGRERLSEQVVRTGMFGVQGTPDTSGYGGLKVRQQPPVFSSRPYGSYFDDIADALGGSLEQSGSSFGDAVERVVVDRGELTFHIRRDQLVAVYPTCDWHERETWDFFGIIFDGHPALTRIEMPDDWRGHPQRKDYPLGGIPVEYRGATVPPPDERRSYA